MAGFFDSSKESTKTSSETSNPWAEQTPYLQQAFSGASTALGQAQQAPKPTDFIAGLTPQQQQLYSQMFGFGTGAQPGVQNAQNAGNAITGMGANAFTQGVNGLSGFQPSSFDSILANANKAANDPSIQGQIDAAMRDSRRSVSEGVLPQIGRNAASTGNVNSSRTGVAEGIVQRGLADQTGDVSSALRGQAYQGGLQSALQSAMAGDSNKLNASQGLTSAGLGGVGQGLGALTGAAGLQGGLFDIANQGAAGMQQGNQLGFDNQMAKYQFGTSSPFDALNSFYNIVGSNNWGGTKTGTSTGTETSSPSTMDNVSKGVGMAAMMFSDRRLKKNVTKVGTLDNGLNVYRYRYVGDDKWRIGLIAQEVQEKKPEAVGEFGGYLMVDYRLATQD